MKVKEGQVLARLDDSNVRTELNVAEAELQSTRLTLEETRAQLKQADQEFARDTDLANAKLISPSDLDKAESDAMTLRARVTRQAQDITTGERQVDLWKQQIEDKMSARPSTASSPPKTPSPVKCSPPFPPVAASPGRASARWLT